jgi:hypothetical protein
MLLHMKWALGAACLTTGSASALCGWLDAAEAWFEKNDPEGVAFQHKAMDVPTG